MDVANAEQVQCEADTDDVANGIERTDFMEVNFFDIDTVYRSLGFGEGAEDALHGVFHFTGQGGSGNHFENAGEMAVFLLSGRGHLEFSGLNTAAIHAGPGDGGVGGKGGKRFRDGSLGRAGVSEGTNQHVAGNTGKGVNVAEQDNFSLKGAVLIDEGAGVSMECKSERTIIPPSTAHEA